MANIPIQHISENISLWTDTLHLSVSEEIAVTERTDRLFNLGPIIPPDPSLDTVFDCSQEDSAGNPDAGVLKVTTEILGIRNDITIQTEPLEIYTEIYGNGIPGLLVGGTILSTLTEICYSKVYVTAGEQNFIQWSKIGTLDFTIDNSNIAGKRPMPWAGMVHRIIKTPTGAIVYGANGITAITPMQNERSRYDENIPEAHTYSPQTIYETGIKGKHGVVETNQGHYCVDVNGYLCRVTSEGIQVLDFSEYLSTLSNNIVMSFDSMNSLIYICDGAIGFVYNIKDNSLGQGPISITGVGYKNGKNYILSPNNIIIPTFDITFDILDFETTRSKTIHSVEIGASVNNILSLAFDYRNSKADIFSTTPWVLVNPKGQAYLPCYGKEFRLKMKMNTYELFNISWIKIHGDINDN